MDRQTKQGTAVAMGTRAGTSRAGITGVKVFSATMFADRERLGQRITDWLAANTRNEIIDMVVTQSSDASFHCLAITIFYREP